MVEVEQGAIHLFLPGHHHCQHTQIKFKGHLPTPRHQLATFTSTDNHDEMEDVDFEMIDKSKDDHNAGAKDRVPDFEMNTPETGSDLEKAVLSMNKQDTVEDDEDNDGGDEMAWDNREILTKDEHEQIMTLNVFSHSEEMKHHHHRWLEEEAAETSWE